MDADEITFEDLLREQPSEAAPVSSFAQLRAEGFPHKGGLADLAAIATMAESGARFAALRQGYLELLEAQSRAPAMRSQVAGGTQRGLTDQSRPASRATRASDS